VERHDGDRTLLFYVDIFCVCCQYSCK